MAVWIARKSLADGPGDVLYVFRNLMSVMMMR